MSARTLYRQVVSLILRTRFLGEVFSVVGLVSAILGMANAINPSWINRMHLSWLMVAIPCAMLWFAYKNWPLRSLRFSYPNGPWRVEILYGDLFDNDTIAVTTDRDHTFELGRVGSESLVAQLVNSWYGGTAPIISSDRPQHGLRMGSAYRLCQGHRSAFLVSMGPPAGAGEGTRWWELWGAFVELWRSVRKSHVSELAVPALGAGFSGTTLSHRGVLLVLLLSFHASSLDSPVTRVLRIVIRPNEMTVETTQALHSLLKALGYTQT